MSADLICTVSAEPTCYFSLLVPPSIDSPDITPLSAYLPDICSNSSHPLLAARPDDFLLMSGSSDASRLLQLQTAATNRPAAEPLQHRDSSTSSTSSSSSSSSNFSTMSSQSISCCRCRRDCLAGMYQIGTNRYYCSHCARMTGYSAG